MCMSILSDLDSFLSKIASRSFKGFLVGRYSLVSLDTACLCRIVVYFLFYIGLSRDTQPQLLPDDWHPEDRESSERRTESRLNILFSSVLMNY